MNIFDEYESFHQSEWNRWLHYPGVILLQISILGLLSQLIIFPGGFGPLRILRWDAAMVVWVIATIASFFWSRSITISFSFYALGSVLVGRHLPLTTLCILFAIGFLLQFLGHAIFEKKRPAFASNLLHLLVGPIWVFKRIIGLGLVHRGVATRLTRRLHND